MTDKVIPSDMAYPAGFPAALASLFENTFGIPPEGILLLPGAGSDRSYWRLRAGGVSAIGVVAPDLREARAFCGLDRYFRTNGIRVPLLLDAAPDSSLYLLEDLGDIQLLSVIDTPAGREAARKAMRDLARIQTLPREEWEPLTPYAMERRQVMWDLSYFKYEFLKPSGVRFDEELLENDFEDMADRLLSIPPERCGFMYRDCQSRNVMVRDGDPYWIDFQGGRHGPCLYDAVSFIWQARAALSEDFRSELLGIYADEFCRIRSIPAGDLLSDLPLLRTFRLLQTLGAYGFRGLVERKSHFLASIPAALANLGRLVGEGVLGTWPELARACSALSSLPRFTSAPLPEAGKLTITVFSFSYKKGYPDDFSGNGGGFMFDCRAVPNPGRLERYRSGTGVDADVIEYLENHEETFGFLRSALSLAESSARRYLERGFTSLQLGFGCTGGRHRSVYSAEAAARVLAARFPGARVFVVHRERGWSRRVLPDEIRDGRYSERHLAGDRDIKTSES